MHILKRKIYKRGSSYETTIPLPILLTLDPNKKYNILFKYDHNTQKWYIEFEERKDGEKKKTKKKK